MKSLLVLGCGYLGERLAARWQGPVAALTRSAARADTFASRGWRPVIGDVCDPALRLPAADCVLWAVGLDHRTGRSMREVYVEGLDNALSRISSAGRTVMISSTGVYGQAAGEWVDESAATVPGDESGRVVLDAESVARRHDPSTIILRLAGIYGAGRWLRRLEQLHAGEPISGDPDAWLNLIHVDDAVAATLAAFDRAQPGSTFNVADGHPVRRRDYFTALAEAAGAPQPVFSGVPGPRPANRRIASERIWAELGLRPGVADYRVGLAQLQATRAAV